MSSLDAAAARRHPLSATALERGDAVGALALVEGCSDPAALRLAGRALLALGDRDGARRSLEAALVAADSPLDAVHAHQDLATVARSMGELADAARHLDEALTLAPAGACRALHREAAALAHRTGRLDDAERHAAHTLEVARPGEGPAALDRLLLGAILVDLERHAEAVTHLGLAVDELARSRPAGHIDVIHAQTELAEALRGAGQPQRAADTLAQVLGRRESAFGLDHPALASTLLALSIVSEELGDAEQARTFAQRAMRVLEDRVPADDPTLREARARALP